MKEKEIVRLQAKIEKIEDATKKDTKKKRPEMGKKKTTVKKEKP